MTSPPTPATPPAPDTANAPAPALEGRDLTKHFPVRTGLRTAHAHAVDGVSIGLARSSVTAVVGESGSGKSTLARMLARLIRPTAGQLLLDGADQPWRRRTDRGYRRRVQLVLQDPFSSLNPVHDIRYHLARPLRIHGTHDGGDLDTCVEELLDRVALTPARQFLRKYPHELSGGQRQRVAIARALAVRPEVLLADEPVSMLDVSIRLGVLNLLADLRDREGLALLYVTHDIASARYLADRITVMYAGQLVESGPAVELTDAPAHPYTRLLLSAAPDPERSAPPSLAGAGTPPSLVNPPNGCRFHPRCPLAMPVCSTTPPVPTEVAPDHHSSCWLHVPGHERREAGSPAEVEATP